MVKASSFSNNQCMGVSATQMYLLNCLSYNSRRQTPFKRQQLLLYPHSKLMKTIFLLSKIKKTITECLLNGKELGPNTMYPNCRKRIVAIMLSQKSRTSHYLVGSLEIFLLKIHLPICGRALNRCLDSISQIISNKCHSTLSTSRCLRASTLWHHTTDRRTR